MKRKNICKLIPSSVDEKLLLKRFILETDPKTMSTPYRLAANRMMLISSGEGVFHFDSAVVSGTTGMLLFAFSGETVFVTPDSKTDCEYMYIDFDGVRGEELLHRFGIHGGLRCFDSFEGVAPLWKESLSRASEHNMDIVAESLLLYTFSRFSAQGVEENNVVAKMVRLIEENFSDMDFSLGEVAAELSYNAKYLSHLFKHRMGIGFSEYLRIMRIKYAVSLFDHGLDSVKNVALLSGFSDPLYFSTVFKKELGVSPSEYVAK